MATLKEFIQEQLHIETNLDIYYIAFLLLMCSNKRKFDDIPELCLVLNEDNLERFIDVFGGRTINVPTKKQLSSFLKAVMVYYYTQQGYTRKEAYKKVGVSNDRDVYNNLKLLEKEIYKFRLPDNES